MRTWISFLEESNYKFKEKIEMTIKCCLEENSLFISWSITLWECEHVIDEFHGTPETQKFPIIGRINFKKMTCLELSSRILDTDFLRSSIYLPRKIKGIDYLLHGVCNIVHHMRLTHIVTLWPRTSGEILASEVVKPNPQRERLGNEIYGTSKEIKSSNS